MIEIFIISCNPVFSSFYPPSPFLPFFFYFLSANISTSCLFVILCFFSNEFFLSAHYNYFDLYSFYIFFLCLSGMSLGFLWALTLPSVKSSIYFHRSNSVIDFNDCTKVEAGQPEITCANGKYNLRTGLYLFTYFFYFLNSFFFLLFASSSLLHS